MYPASLLVVLLWVRELASTREQRGLFSVVLDRHGAVMTELPFVMLHDGHTVRKEGYGCVVPL